MLLWTTYAIYAKLSCFIVVKHNIKFQCFIVRIRNRLDVVVWLLYFGKGILLFIRHLTETFSIFTAENYVCYAFFLKKKLSHCRIKFVIMKNCILSLLILLMPISPCIHAVFFFVLAKHSNKAQVCKNEFQHKIIILPFFPFVA